MLSTLKKTTLILSLVFVVQSAFAQNWKGLQKIVPEDRKEVAYFGVSCAIQDSIAAIGTLYDGVYIFKQNENKNWIQRQIIVPSFFDSTYTAGGEIAMSDSLLAFKSSILDSVTNKIYSFVCVFVRNKNDFWEKVQILKASDHSFGQAFGSSITIFNTTIAIGDHYSKNYLNRGTVYIFNKTDKNTWSETQMIELNNDLSFYWNGFGSTIALTENYLFVGDPSGGDDVSTISGIEDSGHVYIYKKNIDGSWSYFQRIQGREVGLHNHFGISVDAEDSLLLVGSRGYKNGSGTSYLYQLKSSNKWEQTKKIDPPSSTENSGWFGQQVAIKTPHLLIGAPGHLTVDSNSKTNRGASYLYKMVNEDSIELLEEIVSQEGQQNGNFGNCVDLYTNHFIIGENWKGAAFINGICKQTISTETIDGCIYAISEQGTKFTESGEYCEYLLNKNGCDSIIQILANITQLDTTIISTDTLLASGEDSATYAWLDCNANVDSLKNNTSKIFRPAKNGDYKLLLKKNGCSYTTGCVSFSFHGSDVDSSLTKDECKPYVIYPNPTSKSFYIKYTPSSSVKLVLHNSIGELLWNNYIFNLDNEEPISIENASGIYLLSINTLNCPSQHFKIVKY